MEASGQLNDLAAVPPVKPSGYRLSSRLGGSQSSFGHFGEEEKSLPRRESNHKFPFQPVALSHCRLSYLGVCVREFIELPKNEVRWQTVLVSNNVEGFIRTGTSVVHLNNYRVLCSRVT